MTTLIDKELFDYLAHLESEVSKRLSISTNKSLQYLMHSQMRDVIDSEIKFLKYINSNGTEPMLSISPNGLPSVASLNPDLEKMCELKEPDFDNITQRYKKGVDNNEKRQIYVSVSEEKWNKKLKHHKSGTLSSRIGFAVSETEEGKFELALREELYLKKGYDQYAKEFPILIREGKMRYHALWNRLIEDSRESFYVPDTALALSGKPIESSEKLFDNVTIKYKFKKRDLQLTKKPFLWWTRWALPKDYPNLVAAGTNSRVDLTERILDTLTEVLGKKVSFKKVNRKNLYKVLSFPDCRFTKMPGWWIDDIYQKFTLVNGSKNPVGTIMYCLPYTPNHPFGNNYGNVSLLIQGSVFENYPQYLGLQRRLKRKNLLPIGTAINKFRR